MTSIVKAVGMLKYDDEKNGYKVLSFTPKQERLIDGIANFGAKVAKNAGRADLAEIIDKKVGIDKGIQAKIKALEPKKNQKNRGYSHDDR